MNENKPSTGKRFSHVYCERGEPAKDSILFRRRLGVFIDDEFDQISYKLAVYVRKESGIAPFSSSSFINLFEREDIHTILDLITIIWRFLKQSEKLDRHFYGRNKWRDWVDRVLKEENIGYWVDEACGIHYLVDQEFEHNRFCTLKYLNRTEYTGIRDAFTSAYHYFDCDEPDTKAAVRSMFESLEILAKLLTDCHRLNKSVVKDKLKKRAEEAYRNEPTVLKVIPSIFNSFAEWVDSIQVYRHGQNEPEPVNPPIEIAVLVLSSGASYLRWLLEIDQKGKGN